MTKTGRLITDENLRWVALQLPDCFTADQCWEAARRFLILCLDEKAVGASDALGIKREKLRQQFLLNLLAHDGIRLAVSTIFNWRRRYGFTPDITCLRLEGLIRLVDRRAVRTST